MAALDELPFPSRQAPAEAVPARDPRDAGVGQHAQREKRVCLLFLSLFAVLLASFPARDSDLWAHLAAGRRVAHGDYPDGSASPTWLYDLLCYGVYSGFGGAGLVFCKVLLIVGLAVVLFRLSRAGPAPGIAAACTALALLALGTRLLVQPTTVSYLLLALAPWLESRGQQTDDAGKARGDPTTPVNPWLPPWPLMLLFVVWVNVDRWFVLGLGVTALVWLGRALDARAAGSQAPDAFGGRSRRVLYAASRTVILAAVCLLNPNHVHAFALPPELGWFAPAWSSATFLEPVISPFQGVHVARFGLSPAALAYYSLLGLGLLSFALNRARWSRGRFLPWFGLALLSGFDARGIPFFAVVGGPALAWNLGEWRATRAARRGRIRYAPYRSPGATFAGAALGVACLACAWPGWLRTAPFEPPRWTVELSPSPERGAAALRRGRAEGKLRPGSRGLHLSPETANAFAWFYPEEAGVLDARISAALVGLPEAPRDLAERMRSAGVDHVIVYDRDRQHLLAALARLARDPEQWPLLHVEGDLTIFGWRDPAGRAARRRQPRADPFRGLELDLNQLVFRPADDKKAPRQRPDREPEPRRWWDAFWKRVPPRSIDSEEATRHVVHAEALRLAAPYRHLEAWDVAQSAGLAAAAPGWTCPGGLLDASLRLSSLPSQLPKARTALAPLTRVALQGMEWYSMTQDDTPPALLYLAVRAARRALAVNPSDAAAHLALGESYLRLLNDTRERVWARRVPELLQLRRVQASTALNHALALKPDLAKAHLRLGGLYQEMEFLDLALHHLRRFQELRGQVGGPDFVAGLAKRVAEREQAYAAEAEKGSVGDRAVLAFQKGLAGKARDLLLGSDLAAFGVRGMTLELQLLLGTGRAKAVREWTNPEQRSDLGPANYHWLRTQALAASGDYALAQEECVDLASAGGGQGAAQARALMTRLIGQAVLDEQPVGASWVHLPWRALGRANTQNHLASFAKNLRQEANANVVRGLLTLEQGDVEEAEVAFRLALALWKDEAAVVSGAGLDFSTRRLAQVYLRWLEEVADKERK